MKTCPETILVVDDNEDDVVLLKHALQHAGVINPLQTLDNGAGAIAYLEGKGPYEDRSRFPYPSFMLLDLHLPMQTGFDVLEWLRRNPQPKLKAVVCTGTATPAEVEKAYKLGAEQVLQKTADYRKFVKYLQSLPGKEQPRPQGMPILSKIKRWWLSGFDWFENPNFCQHLKPAENLRMDSGTPPMCLDCKPISKQTH